MGNPKFKVDPSATDQVKDYGTHLQKPEGKIDPDQVNQDIGNGLSNEDKGIFKVKTANQWIEEASKRPVPKMLFDELLYERELGILFSDTGCGKSILSVQIANSISKGEKIQGFEFEAEKQKVVYFDFELSDKQFEKRYSRNYTDHYKFSNNLLRVELNPLKADYSEAGFSNIEDYLNFSIEKTIQETKAKILIVDNITYLKNGVEKAKDALPLMKHLNFLKRKFGLSILALAHTPKRDLSRPITINDLQGSKMLANFCDSCFAIGTSHRDSGIRYLKQIKVRSSELKYDMENVIKCQIHQPDNFLRFEYMGWGNENEFLKLHTDDEKTALIKEVKSWSEKGLSQRKIAKEMNISVGAVNKYLKKAKELETVNTNNTP